LTQINDRTVVVGRVLIGLANLAAGRWSPRIENRAVARREAQKMFEGLSASIPGKKFLRWQFAEICEADNTDFINLFQICSSNAFGLASPLVSLKPSGPQPFPAAQNESTAFSESLRAVEPICRRSRKLGPVRTAGHPLIKPESRVKNFLPLSRLVPPKLFSICYSG
jgi:hypothetical protein